MAEYPDFEKTCGYGSVTGIGGANCRHSFWPYIEGVSERTYTDSELESMKPENRPKIKFEGREYDDYQATQKQRQIERTVRKLRRRKTAFEAAGLTEDAQAANIRLQRLNKEYRAFSKAAGLPEQRERMRVLYPDGSAIKSTAKSLEKQAKSGIMTDKEIAAVKRYISSDSYRLNSALRGEQPLTEKLAEFRDGLDAALQKLPVYRGVTYRSISDFGIPDVNEFLRGYKPGSKVQFQSYLSSSTDVYDSDFPIQYVIRGKTGRDLREFNPNKFEVLFPRGITFLIQKVDGAKIYMEEVDDG